MSVEKFKRFVIDHKKELIATTAIAGGIVLIILGCKRHGGKMVKSNCTFRKRDISIPDELKAWDTSFLWMEGEHLNAIIESIPMEDLGELGQQYIKHGFAKPGDNASIIIGVKHKK